MRREIAILWIEDDKKSVVRQLQNEVEKIITDAYYQSKIIEVSNVESAKEKIKTMHIDLIFSDNNLSSDKEGVDFLTEYRSEGKYKYYILYSNLDENQIVEKIIKKLEENKKIHLFSNFDFISLNDWQDSIDDSIKAFLNNRSKIEELRNMYIVENSLIEDKLKVECSSNYNYKKLIETYVRSNPQYGYIENRWHEIREDRNTLAHGKPSFENGINIVTGNEGRVVSENDFENKVKALKELGEELKKLNFFS